MIARLPRFAAILLAIVVAACCAWCLTVPPARVQAGLHGDYTDVRLYRDIADAVAAGRGYYPAAAAIQRAHHYPLRPFVTVRPPTMTWWAALVFIVAPPIALLVALGFHFDYPAIKGFNFQGGILAPNFVFALWFGLSIYTATYIAEIVRSGIQAVSHGQTEAAYALGLRPGRTMSLVVLPQALRVIVPPLISQFLNLTKNSTLAAAISYPDLGATLGGITLNQTGRALECILLMMLTYLIISLLISIAMNLFNRSVRLKER